MAGVRDPESILGIEYKSLWPLDPPVARSFVGETQYVLVLRRELVDSIIASIFADVDVAVAIDGHVSGKSELAGPFAQTAESELLFSVAIKDHYTRIMGVRRPDAIVLVHAQTGRFTVLPLRHLPSSLIFPVRT